MFNKQYFFEIIIIIIIIILCALLVIGYSLREPLRLIAKNNPTTDSTNYHRLNKEKDNEMTWEKYIMTKKYLNCRACLPDSGVIANQETAIKIAEIIWFSIYGEKIYIAKPFIAKLIDGKIWRVTGTGKLGYSMFMPYAEIRKSDGKFVTVFAEK